MSNSSLQDQLLKLGLAKSKPSKPSNASKASKPAKAARVDNKNRPSDAISLARAYAERARMESQEKAREARRRREEQERRRRANARLTELILPNARNDPQAEESRYFQHAGKIRKLFVSAEQQQGLTEGTLGIVSFKGRYHILEASLLGQVKEIKSEALVFFATDANEDEN